MNWSALTKKQRQMVVMTAVLAVSQIALMAHFLGWTKPAAVRGGSAKKELTELEQKIADAHAILRQEVPIWSSLDRSVSSLEALTVHTPALSDRYAWVYEYVSRCAAQSQVTLDNLEEVKAPSDQPYEISTSALCGYNNLVEFLWRLEKDNPLLRIKKVTIASAQESSQVHRVHIILQWPASIEIEKRTQ